jgi:hypothetical protein
MDTDMPMLTTYFNALSDVMAAESRLLAQVFTQGPGVLAIRHDSSDAIHAAAQRSTLLLRQSGGRRVVNNDPDISLITRERRSPGCSLGTVGSWERTVRR